eukprot:510640-Pyramimonas_sp.AAC.1
MIACLAPHACIADASPMRRPKHPPMHGIIADASATRLALVAGPAECFCLRPSSLRGSGQ